MFGRHVCQWLLHRTVHEWGISLQKVLLFGAALNLGDMKVGTFLEPTVPTVSHRGEKDVVSSPEDGKLMVQARDGVVECHPGVVGEIPGVGSGAPEKGLALLGRVAGQHVGRWRRGEGAYGTAPGAVFGAEEYCVLTEIGREVTSWKLGGGQ